MALPTRRDAIGTACVMTAALGVPVRLAAAAGTEPASPSPRETVALDEGWRFHLGHASDPTRDFDFGRGHDTYAKAGQIGSPIETADYDDSDWQAVTLPHDWAVDLPFQPFGKAGGDDDRVGAYQGFKPIGRRWPETSVGWYRRRLPIAAADAGRRLLLEFDGVARDCLVVLNGFVVGSSESGYAPFHLDITDFIRPGADNILLVRCDVSLGEAWSYEGAGLYRAVRLIKTAPAHLRRWGTAIRPIVDGDAARVAIVTEIANDGPARNVRVRSTIIAPDGREIAKLLSDPLALPAWGAVTHEAETRVVAPALWSPSAPSLHRLVHELVGEDGIAIDRENHRFGIRTVVFDAKRGLFINGEPVVVKGTCNHQDHAGVGFAVPDSLHRWRIQTLMGMGSNAYRSTHHPAAPAILDACDELGMLVMDETRQSSSNPEALGQLERMIRHARNHPSIILWSIGNEEVHRGTDNGRRIAETQKRHVRALDPTRPVTEAFNGKFGEGASPVLDVMGFNYYLDAIDGFHTAHPDTPTIGTETGSTVMVRGEYVRDDKRGIVPAYDTEFPKWASTAERWWSFYAARPWIAGGFVWTGFDYRGEPTPFEGWPNNASNFGQLDLCGFPKDNYHYYRAWWSGRPVLHLFPHWNWAGREGQEIAVWVHSNCDAVELFLNGRSLGRKTVEPLHHLAWQVPYAPGRIEAHGYRDGRRILTDARETTTAPARIALSSDRRLLGAGEVAVVRAAILDTKGREHPTAANRVRFALEGDARLLGVGNGDPRSLEPDHADDRSAFNGLCMAIVQAGAGGGAIRLTATGEGLSPALIALSGPSRR
jgi:beta-galactosidase